MSTDPLLYVRAAHWDVLLPCFSDSARVKILDLEVAPIPMEVDEPVATFQWPVPSVSYRVGVDEPDFEGFEERRKSAGIPAHTFEQSNGFIEEQTEEVPTEDASPFPGSVVPHICPNCPGVSLRVSEAETTLHYARKIAQSKHEILRHEPCERHGIHAYIGGKLTIAIECTNCCARFVLIDGMSRLLHIREES